MFDFIFINRRDIQCLKEEIMAKFQDVKDALTQAAADAVAEKQEVADALKALADQVQALKDQLASGEVVTPAQLDEVVASINAVDAQVKDITVPVTPAP